MLDADVIVVGAGAAGLMAAIRAAERGRRVLLLEKGRKPGVKILMSGGTRCNITHDCDERGIVAAFGSNGKFLHSALAALGPADVVEFFNSEGVATKIEETGKIFPVSDRAVDVLDALLRRLQRSGATLSLAEPVVKIESHLAPGSAGERSESKPPQAASTPGEGAFSSDAAIAPSPAVPMLDASEQRPLPHEAGGEVKAFRIITPQRKLTCETLLITTGGRSFPGCGTTGDGYAWAAQFGHTILPQRPALVPLTTKPPWVAELRGITLPNVNLKVLEENKVLTQRRGSMLFAHFGLTGPAPLDVSRAVSGHAKPSTLVLEVDLLPTTPEAAFDEFLRIESLASGKKQLAVVMSEKLPRRICDQVLTLCGQSPDRRAGELSKVVRADLVRHVKRLPIPLAGTLGFEKAEVTAGGVSLNEVDSRTMRSKLVPNLFFAGEVLDLDGWIGGYNFQSAWSTGWLAGANL